MKKLKKVFAVLLTLAMVLGMSMTSFAATATTITVNNVEKAQTVKYVQIVEADQTSPSGWKFLDDSYATAFKNAYGVTTDAAVFEAMKLTDPDGNAASGTINSSNKLATALNALKNDATADATKNGATATITASTAGLYLIVAQGSGYTYIPMLAYVGINGDALVAATVTAKGSEDQVKKDVKEEAGKSVAPGETVAYTATVEYPFYAPNVAAENRKFTVVDTVENATHIQSGKGAVQVKDETGAAVDVAGLVTYSTVNGNSVMTIDFSGANYNANLAGKVLTIEYSVVVNETISETGLANTIKSTIKPNGEGEGEDTEYKVVSKPVTFKVIKHVEGEPDALLSGAVFTLYREAVSGEDTAETDITYEGKTLKQVAVSSATDSEGECTFTNLDAQGTYYVKETQAPEGYSLNDTVYTLTGAKLESDAVVENVKTYVYSNFTDQRVGDTTLSALPSTGGIGTTIFTIGGCAIMVIAAALFFASRRKSAK